MYLFLLGMDFRISVLVFVVSIGILTGFYVLEPSPEETVEVEGVESDRVPPAEITMYSELSSSEQKQFRSILNGGEVSVSDTELNSKYRFIELDYRVYEFDVYKSYGLITYPVVFALFGSVFGLVLIRASLQDRDTCLFDSVLSVCIASVIVLMLFTGSGGSVLTESQIAMSTVPVDVEDDSSIIDIQYVRDDVLRDSLFESMRGGEPVSEESLSDSDFTLIASGSTGDYSSFVERYEYVSSDGEYYKITQLEDQLTGTSITHVAIALGLVTALVLYAFFSLFSYAEYFREKE
jgi:hypothetical protein